MMEKYVIRGLSTVYDARLRDPTSEDVRIAIIRAAETVLLPRAMYTPGVANPWVEYEDTGVFSDVEWWLRRVEPSVRFWWTSPLSVMPGANDGVIAYIGMAGRRVPGGVHCVRVVAGRCLPRGREPGRGTVWPWGWPRGLYKVLDAALLVWPILSLPWRIAMDDGPGAEIVKSLREDPLDTFGWACLVDILIDQEKRWAANLARSAMGLLGRLGARDN